jgi:hypothetical protein
MPASESGPMYFVFLNRKLIPSFGRIKQGLRHKIPELEFACSDFVTEVVSYLTLPFPGAQLRFRIVTNPSPQRGP